MGPVAEADKAGNLTARFPNAAGHFPKRGHELILETEYHALDQLRGPGVVQVVGFSRAQEASILWLERVAFGSLLALAGRPGSQWLPFAAQAARHLARIHHRGWVHGDVKAEHVRFLTPNTVCWIDFGSATKTGMPRGPVTPAAADPAAGELASPEQDVYGFGLLLLQLKSGHLAVGDGHAEANDIGWRCLAPEAKQRPTMLQMAEELTLRMESERGYG